MSGMAVEDESVHPGTSLTFHPDFANKQTGDIILCSDDDQSFCFSLSHLAALSSFFSTLPPPSGGDLVDGTPLIPLQGATSLGLAMALDAIRSTLSFEPYRYPISIKSAAEAERAVLAAAVIARKYDLPIVLRLLHEAVARLGRHAMLSSPSYSYLIFAIWAIGDVESQLPFAASQTRESGEIAISCVSSRIVRMCKDHAPRHWMQLLEFHLRHAQAVQRFRQEMVDLDVSMKPYHVPTAAKPCGAGYGWRQVVWGVHARLTDLTTMEEVAGICNDSWGIDICDHCRSGANQRYDPLVERMEDYATAYILDSSWDEM